ncbi:Osmotin, thaumatin-like protein [Xylariaceae sp. FL0662B]|nr:Osmotin, thaumatin-like protein [Xylariaceae sp. FL0662B]
MGFSNSLIITSFIALAFILVPCRSSFAKANPFTSAPLSPSPVPRAAGGGPYIITLVNSHTAAITTQRAQNLAVQTAVRAEREQATIEPHGSAIIEAPTGWAGRVAVQEAGYDMSDRDSLLEGSFIVQEDAKARITLDVSYVDGFTLPIVCICNSVVVLGCNLNLLEMCPDKYLLNNRTCMNPFRDAPPPGDSNFFSACSPMAYTYPTDDGATISVIDGCEERITCCVGTSCPPHPKQKLCPGKADKDKAPTEAWTPSEFATPDAARSEAKPENQKALARRLAYT